MFRRTHFGSPFPLSASRMLCSLFFSALLTTCSSTPEAPSGAPAGAHPNPGVEVCSTFGAAACRAMALLSSDAASTCSVSVSPSGGRREMCGTVAIAPKPQMPAAGDSSFHPVQLQWTDNSDNESHFIVERCDGQAKSTPRREAETLCTGTWNSIATVAANITRYVDNTARAGQTYIYRIKAVNSSGSSAYTPESIITAPAR